MWEVYNTDKVFPKLRSGWITTEITPDGETEAVSAPEKISYTTAVTPTARHIHFLSIPIDSLPSGNYLLRNKLYAPDGNIALEDSLFFQRSNPRIHITAIPDSDTSIPLDTLKMFIDYLHPIAKGSEVDFIRNAKRDSNYRQLADFFRHFWEKRSPDDPWDGWYRYYCDVKRVNNKYTTLKFKGYKTDRGYYYLKYGAPDDIEYYPIENGLNPYEIWRYYQLDDQTDVYFIFGDLDLNTKNYTMICSNKKDEIYDPRWKFRLKPKDLRPTDIEMTE
jgi:GWxTD domain-containing protein